MFPHILFYRLAIPFKLLDVMIALIPQILFYFNSGGVSETVEFDSAAVILPFTAKKFPNILA